MQFPHMAAGHFLNVGEMSFGVALAYDWLYDWLSPSQKRVLEEGLYSQAVVKGIGAYNGTSDEIDDHHGTHGRSGWTKAKTNWNAVCNAGLTMSSIALANVYPSDCEWLLGNIITSIEAGVVDYAPDGGLQRRAGLLVVRDKLSRLVFSEPTKRNGHNVRYCRVARPAADGLLPDLYGKPIWAV